MASTDADRLALALCTSDWDFDDRKCKNPCTACRRNLAAVTRELAQILRERHGGSSQVADWLDGVGEYP
jgi:hypothetical protein